MMDFLGSEKSWVLISFLIFLYVFFKYAYSFVIEKIDARIADIKTELQTVETLRVEAQELLAQYQRKHKDALKEADEIIALAKSQAENIKAQAMQDMESAKARREKQLQDRLARIEREALQDIQNHTVTLAIQASKDLIIKNSDKKASKAMLDKSLENIPEQLH